MTLVRVVAPHFVAGFVLDDAGVAIEAAPILRWVVGKTRRQIWDRLMVLGYAAARVEEIGK